MKNPGDKIKRIGLVGHSGKVSCSDVVARAVRLIRAQGRTALADVATAESAGLKIETCPDAAALAVEVDLLLVFGGDGTMLRVARYVAGSNTPILGVNIGRLGFLTAVPARELARALRQLWAGEFHLESRALIEASTRINGKTIRQVALNDIVVSRGVVSRLIQLDVDVDGEPLPEEGARGDQQGPLVGDHVAHEVRQPAVGERDVRSAVEDDDLGRLVQASQPGRAGGAPRHAAYDQHAHADHARPLPPPLPASSR